jgi:multiple sugar transport system substrate-binding protein
MMKKLALPLLSFILAALAGCGNLGIGTADTQDSRAADLKPVTLSLFVDAAINDQEIDKFIVRPVQKKYPNISFTITKKGGGITSDTFVASGAELDLVYTSYNLIEAWRQLDMPEDLSGLMKKYKTDLNKFDPAVVDEIEAYSGRGGAMLALPVMQNIAATIYNKDIFDKFGVAYPKDLISWDEAISLAHKLTRSEGGIRYIGLSPPSFSHVGQGLSLPYVNPDTQKAAIR